MLQESSSAAAQGCSSASRRPVPVQVPDRVPGHASVGVGDLA